MIFKNEKLTGTDSDLLRTNCIFTVSDVVRFMKSYASKVSKFEVSGNVSDTHPALALDLTMRWNFIFGRRKFKKELQKLLSLYASGGVSITIL